MKEYFGNYLGMVISNSDPEYRGRVQVFIPHIMPALYDGWNKEGTDIQISCVGSNIPEGLSPEIHARLMQILPWAEAASPIVGGSSPGNLTPAAIGQAVGGMIGGALGGAAGQAVGQAIGGMAGEMTGRVLNQEPTTKPAVIPGELGALYNEASKYAGTPEELNYQRNYFQKYGKYDETKLAGKALAGYNGGGYKGACGRGTVAALGAMSGNASFKQGSAGGNANDYSIGKSAPNDVFAKSGLYNPKVPAPSNYAEDPSQWRIGDVIACDGGTGFGHIQTYVGVGSKPWTSDTPQSNPLMGTQYKSCALIRATPEAQAKMKAKLDSLYGQGATPPPGGAAEGTGTSADPALVPPTVNPEGQVPTTAPIPPAAPTPQQGAITPDQSIESPSTPGPQPSATPGMKAFLAAVAQGESGFSTKEANTDTYNYPDGRGNPKAANANVRKSMQNVSGYIPSNGNLEAAQRLYGDYGFFQNNDAGEGQAVYNYLKKQGVGEDKANFYRQAITNGTGKGSFSLGDQSQAMVYLMAAKHPTIKAQLDALNPSDPNFSSQVAAITKPLQGKWFGLDEGLAAGAANLNSSAFAKINGDELVNAENATGVAASSTASAPSVVNNTDPGGLTSVYNTNDMAKGMFSYPNPGAMVWVFFREGNPLYPVYFAASYSAREWSSVYKTSSESPDGMAFGENGGPISRKDSFNLDAGCIYSLKTVDYSNPFENKSVLSLQSHTGSNLSFANGQDQLYSRQNRRDQVDRDRFETTMGFKEQWVEGDYNINVRGDYIIKVGKIDQESLDALQKMADYSSQINAQLAQSSSGGGAAQAKPADPKVLEDKPAEPLPSALQKGIDQQKSNFWNQSSKLLPTGILPNEPTRPSWQTKDPQSEQPPVVAGATKEQIKPFQSLGGSKLKGRQSS